MPLFITTKTALSNNSTDYNKLKDKGYPIAFNTSNKHIYFTTPNTGDNDTVYDFSGKTLTVNSTTTHNPGSSSISGEGVTGSFVKGITVSDHNITLNTGSITLPTQTDISITGDTGSESDTIEVSKGGTFDIIKTITSSGTHNHTITRTKSTLTIGKETKFSVSGSGSSTKTLTNADRSFNIVTSGSVSGTNDHTLKLNTATITLPSTAFSDVNNHYTSHSFTTGASSNTATVTLNNVNVNGTGTTSFSVSAGNNVTISNSSAGQPITINSQNIDIKDNSPEENNESGQITFLRNLESTYNNNLTTGGKHTLSPTINILSAGQNIDIRNGVIFSPQVSVTYYGLSFTTLSSSNKSFVIIDTVEKNGVHGIKYTNKSITLPDTAFQNDHVNSHRFYCFDSATENQVNVALSQSDPELLNAYFYPTGTNGISIWGGDNEYVYFGHVNSVYPVTNYQGGTSMPAGGNAGTVSVIAGVNYDSEGHITDVISKKITLANSHNGNHAISSSGTTNTNTYINLTGSNCTGSVQITGAGETTIKQSNNKITISSTDTKTTCGSSASQAKLFIVGALSQSTFDTSYSNSKVYMQDGYLYSNSTKVSVDGHTHSEYLPLAGGTMTGQIVRSTSNFGGVVESYGVVKRSAVIKCNTTNSSSNSIWIPAAVWEGNKMVSSIGQYEDATQAFTGILVHSTDNNQTVTKGIFLKSNDDYVHTNPNAHGDILPISHYESAGHVKDIRVLNQSQYDDLKKQGKIVATTLYLVTGGGVTEEPSINTKTINISVSDYPSCSDITITINKKYSKSFDKFSDATYAISIPPSENIFNISITIKPSLFTLKNNGGYIYCDEFGSSQSHTKVATLTPNNSVTFSTIPSNTSSSLTYLSIKFVINYIQLNVTETPTMTPVPTCSCPYCGSKLTERECKKIYGWSDSFDSLKYTHMADNQYEIIT